MVHAVEGDAAVIDNLYSSHKMFTRLEYITDWFISSILVLEPTAQITQVFNFFLYDSIKIVLLLLLITVIMTYVNSYLPIHKIRDFLTRKKRYWLEYLFASFFGAITPFCSCSSIPLFIWFIKWWVPLGVTFSFLITSPLVNEVALAMFLWVFGVKITAIYMISGIILGILWGFILEKLKLERYLSDFIQNKRKNQEYETKQQKISFSQRSKEVIKEAWNITIKIVPYVLLWVWVGAVIHGFIPTWFFENYITKSNPFAVPIAVIVWIPMYANATSVIPIVQALIAKWIPLGTWLAFMMATVGLSLPEFLILKKIMKTKLLIIFFGIVWICMMILGYFFNAIL